MNKKIIIPFTENDLQEMMSGEEFSWTFPLIVDGKETGESIDVELIHEEIVCDDCGKVHEDYVEECEED